MKKKERELSQEEAMEIARKELQLYWYGTDPLLTTVRGQGGLAVIPVDASLGKRDFLIFFIDPTDLDCRSMITCVNEWYRRFKDHKVEFLMVLKSAYPSYCRTRMAVQDWIRRRGIQFPVVVDHDGAFFEAFGVKKLPRAFLYAKGKVLASYEGSVECMEELEPGVHVFLRENDPGLPLAPAFVAPAAAGASASRFELGKKLRKTTPDPKGLAIKGAWEEGDDYVSTRESGASIELVIPTSCAYVIAKTLSEELTPTRMFVEAADMPVPDNRVGQDIAFDDEGRTYVRVGTEQLFHVVCRLPAELRKLTLKFPDAQQTGVAVFGFRFAELG